MRQSLCYLWHMCTGKIYMQNLMSLKLCSQGLVQLVLQAKESWVGTWEQDNSFGTQCESKSCLSVHHSYKKRSLSDIFCCRYVATMCTKLHAICNHFLTESICIGALEILFAKNYKTKGHIAIQFQVLRLLVRV